MMRRLLFAVSTLFIAGSVHAQPWVKELGNKPVKLEDIVKAMKDANEKEDERANKNNSDNDKPEEGKHYHFDRWKWYWEQHTDENGYLVSPVKNLMEWQKVKQQQAQNKTTGNISAWTFAGPDKSSGGYSGIGRINKVAFHPTDTNTLYVGTAGGGTWKTTDGGVTWSSLGDKFPVMGVSDIAINPLDPNIIFLATGDKEANDTYSVGLLRSADGGTTWDTTGLKWNVTDFRQITGVLINPIDTSSITVSTSVGIYKSNDGGKTFTQTIGGGFKQMLYHPSDTSIIYATGFTTGTNQVFRSADGGYTWTQQSSFGTNARVAIAVTPADVAIVKAIVANGSYGLEGVYSSNDTGKSFTKIYSAATNTTCDGNILASSPSGKACGGQGWYDLTIAINPSNAQNVVAGGVNTWYSTDGGANWQIANQWTGSLPGIKVVHADKHYQAYHPNLPNTLFECNDGGLYKTSNPLSLLWTDLTNGMGITQFYRNAVSNVANYVVGGAQDNGSKKISGTTYSDLTGGDGMNCELDPTDFTTFYTSLQYGELRRTTNSGGNFIDISNNIPGRPTGEWITPFTLHPNNNSILFAGYAKIYMSSDKGTTWNEISPSLGGNAKRITLSPDKDNNIFVTVTSGAIRYTTDLGANWKFISGKPAGDVSDIIADPKNGDRIFVTFSGYGTNKVAEYTLNGTWKTMNENLPDIPVYCIAVDSVDGTLYIGTDFGVYYRAKDMAQWEMYSNGLPNVEVTDLGINYTTNEIWASTYGRGMWKSPRYGYPLGISNLSPYAADVIKVFPNPNKGSFTLQTTNKALLNSNVDVQIVDMQGRTVWKQNTQVPADGKVNIDASLATGSYMVQVLKDNIVFSKAKMVSYQ
ncbi:MAG: T9SS type A sorting domain-containing protein [Flavipsychrobacter sp.]|nr:T9SS type A sorting domain-containing protein [Chitinophagales bacterium]